MDYLLFKSLLRLSLTLSYKNGRDACQKTTIKRSKGDQSGCGLSLMRLFQHCMMTRAFFFLIQLFLNAKPRDGEHFVISIIEGPPPPSHMVCHQAKRELRVGFCRFSVFFFLRILAKETSFGHVVFFVVTPTVLAMPVSLTQS